MVVTFLSRYNNHQIKFIFTVRLQKTVQIKFNLIKRKSLQVKTPPIWVLKIGQQNKFHKIKLTFLIKQCYEYLPFKT